MPDLSSILSDAAYHALRAQTNELRTAWHNSLETGELTKLNTFKAVPADKLAIPQGNPNDAGFEDRCYAFRVACAEREALAKSFVQRQVYAHHPNLQKAGVTSALGFNFYDLRGSAYLIYPVNVHFRNALPRIPKTNAGVGTQANWKATRNVGSPYAGASEGNRGPVGTPDEIDYYAKYKELGVEGSVTFTAEFAGEGYTDNLADEHIRDLHRVMLSEEGMIINGNSGAGGSSTTGYKLGTPVAPTLALAATHSIGTAGNLGTPGNFDCPYTTILTTSNYVSVAVVALTSMGYPNNNQYGYGLNPTIASGLTPQYVRTNADGSTDVINGGTSAISAISSVLQATTGNLTIKATTTAIKGAFAYAWFVDVETSSTGSLAGAKLAGITYNPTAYISGTPTGTQTGAATNGSLLSLSSDCSFNSLDFDGFFSYAAGTAGAYWNDLGGGSLTSQKNGRVTEVETALQYIWQSYQTGVDEIWGDATAVAALDAAIRYSGTNPSALQFFYTRDSQNNILGGFVVSAYQSRFAFNNPTGAMAIPIRIHPMIPAGCLYFHVKNNPYPQSRLPFVAGMMVQRDYYSIEFPQVSRKWPWGTYVHEVLAHNVPWIPGAIVGISATFTGS